MSWFNAQSEPVPANVNTIFPHPSPEVLLSLFGCNNASLKGLANNSFPCALFGFYTTGRYKPWLRLSTLSGSADHAANIKFPLSCTEHLPCTIRTPDPMEGEQAGCGVQHNNGSPEAGTLVAVTWNSTRYFFRPFLYFIGKGNISKVPITDWTSVDTLNNNKLAYEAGLQFMDTTLDNSGTPSCMLALIHVNGTIEMYFPDIDDPTTPLGIKWYATVRSTPSFQPCLPSVTITLFPMPFMTNASLLVVTCQSGQGWLWGLYDTSVSLNGNFSLDPPSVGRGQPLLADVSVVLVNADFCTGVNYVTAIALLGSGFLQPTQSVLADEHEDVPLISFAIFTTSWDSEELRFNFSLVPICLTDRLHASSSD